MSIFANTELEKRTPSSTSTIEESPQTRKITTPTTRWSASDCHSTGPFCTTLSSTSVETISADLHLLVELSCKNYSRAVQYSTL